MQDDIDKLLENETKKCPACAETIKIQAIKCRFCGENFNAEKVMREVNQRLSVLQLLVNDSERKTCPRCHNTNAYWAYIEDGSTGYWCPHCKESLRSILEAAKMIMPQEPSGVVCPHCHTEGHVTRYRVKRKKGISGGKVMGALFTGGFSLLGTGLSRKEWVTEARCSKCGSVWYY